MPVLGYGNTLLSVNGSDQRILQFTPEPGVLLAIGFAGLGVVAGIRRWRR